MIAAVMIAGTAWAGQEHSAPGHARLHDHGRAPAVRFDPWEDNPGKIVIARQRGWGRPWDHRIEKLEHRLARQRSRIVDGRNSGELTPNEARRLWRDYRRIESYSHQALSDKWLSKREWRNLTAMLDDASDKIFRLKNNHRRRVNHRMWGRHQDIP
jgi:hypothetical protein